EHAGDQLRVRRDVGKTILDRAIDDNPTLVELRAKSRQRVVHARLNRDALAPRSGRSRQSKDAASDGIESADLVQTLIDGLSKGVGQVSLSQLTLHALQFELERRERVPDFMGQLRRELTDCRELTAYANLSHHF